MSHVSHRIDPFEIIGQNTAPLRFADGTREHIDFRPMLEGQIFGTLRDPAIMASLSTTMLGVPEVWRCDGTTLAVGRLLDDGSYQWGERSPSFGDLPLAEAARFLQMVHTTDHLTIMRAFRSWVRAQRGNG